MGIFDDYARGVKATVKGMGATFKGPGAPDSLMEEQARREKQAGLTGALSGAQQGGNLGGQIGGAVGGGFGTGIGTGIGAVGGAVAGAIGGKKRAQLSVTEQYELGQLDQSLKDHEAGTTGYNDAEKDQLLADRNSAGMAGMGAAGAMLGRQDPRAQETAAIQQQLMGGYDELNASGMREVETLNQDKKAVEYGKLKSMLRPTNAAGAVIDGIASEHAARMMESKKAFGLELKKMFQQGMAGMNTRSEAAFASFAEGMDGLESPEELQLIVDEANSEMEAYFGQSPEHQAMLE